MPLVVERAVNSSTKCVPVKVKVKVLVVFLLNDPWTVRAVNSCPLVFQVEKRGDADLILGQLGPPTNLGGPPRRIHRSCLKKKISDSRRIFLDLLIASRRIEKKRLPTRYCFHEELDAASRQNNPKGEIL